MSGGSSMVEAVSQMDSLAKRLKQLKGDDRVAPRELLQGVDLDGLLSGIDRTRRVVEALCSGVVARNGNPDLDLQQIVSKPSLIDLLVEKMMYETFLHEATVRIHPSLSYVALKAKDWGKKGMWKRFEAGTPGIIKALRRALASEKISVPKETDIRNFRFFSAERPVSISDAIRMLPSQERSWEDLCEEENHLGSLFDILMLGLCLTSTNGSDVYNASLPYKARVIAPNATLDLHGSRVVVVLSRIRKGRVPVLKVLPVDTRLRNKQLKRTCFLVGPCQHLHFDCTHY